MPLDYSEYPSNWLKEIRPRILARAGEVRDDSIFGGIAVQAKCEWCGVSNYAIGYRDKTGKFNELQNSMAGDDLYDQLRIKGKVIKIVLTIAHIDHNKSNNNDNNLAALCQKCHLNHDRDHHSKNRRDTLERKKGLQKLFP